MFAIVITLLIASVILFTVTFFKLHGYVSEVRELRAELNRLKSDFSKRIGRVEDLIGPNSPLDKYINDVNYLKNILSDLSTVEKALADFSDDPRRGYFRVLVIGSEKVWFEIEHSGRKIFASELFPGLSPYKFYYFKPPNVSIGYVVDVPPDSSIVVGIPDRVFLIFFGVGTSQARPVKIVKLTETYYKNLKESFKLYIPK